VVLLVFGSLVLSFIQNPDTSPFVIIQSLVFGLWCAPAVLLVFGATAATYPLGVPKAKRPKDQSDEGASQQ